jgi:hypothetical protein
MLPARRLLTAGFVKSLANITALSTFFASPAVRIHQIKKHVLFNSRPFNKIKKIIF